MYIFLFTMYIFLFTMHNFLFIVQACLTYRLYPALALSKHLASLHILYNLGFEIGNLWVNELKL